MIETGDGGVILDKQERDDVAEYVIELLKAIDTKNRALQYALTQFEKHRGVALALQSSVASLSSLCDLGNPSDDCPCDACGGLKRIAALMSEYGW